MKEIIITDARSQKTLGAKEYNMIWDKMWNLNLFPNNVIGKEINYYLTKQNPYGLPLDSRKDYTKSDWIMWTAAMSSDQVTFEKFVDPLYKYINETVSRVPVSDWYDTKTGSDDRVQGSFGYWRTLDEGTDR